LLVGIESYAPRYVQGVFVNEEVRFGAMSVNKSQPTRRIVVVSMVLTSIILLIPALFLLKKDMSAVTRISGRVLDENGEPLRGAQVIVTTADPPIQQIEYVDEKGIFFTSVPSSSRTAKVQINAVDHISFERELELKGGSQIEEGIRLTRVAEPVHTAQAVSVQNDVTDFVPSGPGANWSDWYRLCSRPAPEGFRVARSAFHMEGDRNCNAYSECREDSDSDKQVCWMFRMQGHSESVFQNQGRAMSRGVLQTILEPIPEVAVNRERYGVVYIQFSGERNRRLAEELRQELIKDGYKAGEVQQLEFPYPNSVKYFNDADAASASALANTVSAFLKSHQDDGSLVLSVRNSGDTPVPVGQMEVWINVQTVPR
jgi:hypothetical protein